MIVIRALVIERTHFSESVTNRTIVVLTFVKRATNVHLLFTIFKCLQTLIRVSFLLNNRQICKLRFLHGLIQQSNKIYDKLTLFICQRLLVIHKDYFIDKENKKQMAHNYCFSLPSNRQDEPVEIGKVYTEPPQDTDPSNKIELTPLRNSKIQNTINKTAKIVKIKCAPKTNQQTQKKMNLSRIQCKMKTQNSQEKADKTFLKRQQIERHGKFKKNILKPVVYKSNILLHQQSCSYKKLDMSYTDLLPKSRKTSLSFSQHRKNTNQNCKVKQDDVRSSKSKKKIQFTVYQSRKKSQCKKDGTEQIQQKKSSTLLKHIQSVYNLPYPCTSNIVIDLFHGKSNNRLNTSCGKSRDKSASREKSQENRRNDSFGKLNEKDPFSGKNPLIESTLLKLKKFQIVNDYANQLEIENLIKGFILSGEPQCKWVLLVIDEVFKKIRSPPNDKL